MFHRSEGAIVWNIFYNCIAWTTIGTVDERVSISTIIVIEKLTLTIITQGNIWRNQS